MKKLTNFIQKIRAKGKEALVTKEYLVYTVAFFGIMMSIYLVMIFAGMASTPKFTYAEF